MKGIHLRSLSGELYKVAPEHDEKPLAAIEGIDRKLDTVKDYIREEFGDDFDFMKNYHRLPLTAFAGFSFDELCKLHYSSVIMMDESVRKLFETDARYEIVRKIESSFWRWTFSRATWNEVVDAYDNIRNFTFADNPDFEIRLDHSTHFNEYGYSKYNRLFIDGVFAYFVYYKREHVMTIAFSILEGRRLLIQQVQSAKRTGNRFLYKIPKNRVEFVIDLFLKNFPDYQLYVLDGKHLMDKTLTSYQSALVSAHARRERYRRDVEKCPGDARPLRWLKETEEECAEFEAKIAHLEADTSRLISFYKNLGRFQLGTKEIARHGMLHYEVAT